MESNENGVEVYKKVVLGLTIALGLLGVYAIYTVWASDINWGFKINWNCFKSPLFPVLAIVGFFLQFFNWQHTSTETWVGRKKWNGDVEWEKSDDIMDSLFGGCLWPILSHLIIIPCVYGAIMWYAIMGLLHVLGKMSPLLISLLIAAVVFFFYKIANSYVTQKYRVFFLIGFALFGLMLIGGTAYFMTNPGIMSSSAESVQATALKSLGNCEITGKDVNLRQGPGTNYDKLGVTVSSGETYPLLGEDNGWVKIDYNGSPAWLSSKFCNLTYSGSSTAEDPDEDLGYRTDDGESEGIDNEGERIVSKEATEVAQVSSETDGNTESQASSGVQEQSQNATAISDDADKIYQSAEQQAEYPGGIQALMKWLSANIRYPESAQENNIEGRVVVKFVVERDGSITQPIIVKGVNKDLDNEALRVVGNMPKWTPGKSNGEPVRCYYTIPVNFRLK